MYTIGFYICILNKSWQFSIRLTLGYLRVVGSNPIMTLWVRKFNRLKRSDQTLRDLSLYLYQLKYKTAEEHRDAKNKFSYTTIAELFRILLMGMTTSGVVNLGKVCNCPNACITCAIKRYNSTFRIMILTIINLMSIEITKWG